MLRLSSLPIVLAATVAVGVAGCALTRSKPKLEHEIGLIAVLPIEREERGPVQTEEGQLLLVPGAERTVTARIYDVLASDSQWRFVSDVTVTETLREMDPGDAPVSARARALGRAVGADGVLFGTVSRYRERVGARYGARAPASIAFALQLLHVPSGKIVWQGSFEGTQQPLSQNLLNWWQFWRGGPRWFSAEEFTRLAVERTLEDLAARMN